MIRYLFLALLSCVYLGSDLGVRTVSAHPHVWIKARVELVLDTNNNFVAVRHAWQFDEGFSAFATQGLDANGDGKLSREELAELSKVNIEALSEFEYFTYIQKGKYDPKYVAPSEYWLQHDGRLLTLFFTLPMQEPVSADPEAAFQDLTVEVFDPTFFVDISFVREDPVAIAALDGGASVCSAALQRRKELDTIQQQLLAKVAPDEQVPEDIAPLEGELSNTIRVTCPLS